MTGSVRTSLAAPRLPRPALKSLAAFALTPLALALCQPAQAQSLPAVTVTGSSDPGYAPALSSTATKTRAPLRDTGIGADVVPCDMEVYRAGLGLSTSFVRHIVDHGRLVYGEAP